MKVWTFLLAGALAVMGSLPLSAADMKGQAVTLETSDGWSLSGVYQTPTEEHRTVILLHDLGKDKTAFTKFAASLASAGYGYLAFDFRGHGQSINQGEYASFAREGLDNEFNKMPRDVEAAVSFLQKKGISLDNMVLLGAGLGANVAAKSVTLTPDIGSLALITPTTNTRDVLNEMLDKYLIPSLLQWLEVPARPEIKPDLVVVEAEPQTQTDLLLIGPSSTEEALVPSVLE